jgi:hypothetical protein
LSLLIPDGHYPQAGIYLKSAGKIIIKTILIGFLSSSIELFCFLG